jgi:hypothetical protein
MQQGLDSIGWPDYFYPHPSAAMKLYILFSLVAIVAAITRLAALWITAPPFIASRQANNPLYLKRLQEACSSLTQWMGCTLLGGAVVAASDLHQACRHLQESKATSPTLILYRLDYLGESLTLVLGEALLIFLMRWHLLLRIEHLVRNSLIVNHL